jgi:ribosomal protein S18 acetylase RimI-like enzyme
MLIDIKARLDEAQVQELLELAVFPDPDKLKQVIARYKQDDRKLLGYESEGEMIGVIGYSFADRQTIEINHIAVVPEMRGKGYGRGLILELLALEKPELVFAETDEDAVDFYRSIGFIIESLGEKYPGVERFKCTFNVDED